jgi:hypothetical protein
MGLAIVNLAALILHLAAVRKAWRQFRPKPGQRKLFYTTLCFGPPAVELAYGFPIRGGTRRQRFELALALAAKGGVYVTDRQAVQLDALR